MMKDSKLLNKKIVVVNLGNTSACALYGINITESIYVKHKDIIFFGSKTSNYLQQIEELQCQKILIKTYKNRSEFVLNSFFMLPILIIRLLTISNAVFIFPHHHLWHAFIMVFLRLSGRMQFLAVHDDKMHDGVENILESFLTDLQIKLSKKHVYLTEYVRNSVDKRLKLQKDYRIIPLGVFVYPGLLKAIRDISGKEKISLMIFGYIARYKGVHLLIDSFKRLIEQHYNVELKIIGKHADDIVIDENFRSNYPVIIENRFVENNEMYKYFNDADIVVLPYIEASQSGVLAVAQYCCIPSIVTNVGGLPEMVEDGETGIICEPNADDIERKIRILINDREKYRRISEYNFNMNKNRSWDTIAERWLEFIAES